MEQLADSGPDGVNDFEDEVAAAAGLVFVARRRRSRNATGGEHCAVSISSPPPALTFDRRSPARWALLRSPGRTRTITIEPSGSDRAALPAVHDEALGFVGYAVGAVARRGRAVPWSLWCSRQPVAEDVAGIGMSLAARDDRTICQDPDVDRVVVLLDGRVRPLRVRHQTNGRRS